METEFRVLTEVYDKILKPRYDDNYNSQYNGVVFDPEKHLQYYVDPLLKNKFENTRRLTLEELGIIAKDSITNIGVSDPFPLFTPEAIAIMKQETLDKEIFLKFGRFNQFSKSGKDCIIRGFVKTNDTIRTPFTHAAWSHPKTMELISIIAGVELEIIMDYEIAHTNISMKDPKDTAQELADYDADKHDIVQDDYVVGWHRDSYPMVCVLMLSDTTNMIGGATSLKTGTGIVSVPGPTLGSACFLQGGIIEHIAPNPKGVNERIVMVTSYRKKGHELDGATLTTVKPELHSKSRCQDFYADWCDYRNNMVINNLQQISTDIRQHGYNPEALKKKYKDIETYINGTYSNMGFNEHDAIKMKEQYSKKY